MDEIKAFLDTLNFNVDDIELFVRILFQVLLLVSSAVFSGSETALFSLSRIDLQKLRQSRHPDSESIHAMLDEPRRLIISILCGNELVNIASAVNMTAILLIVFAGQDVGWINILIMVPLLLLIGEVTPKTVAVSFPIKFSTFISARILPRWMVLITPLRAAVRLVADRITTLVVGDAVDRENILQPDELRTLLEEGEETGIIDATERVLIDNLLEASEMDISRIMTPGPRICFLDAALPVDQLIDQFRSYRHPRVPVYKGHWDNVIGFIHSEDILKLVRGGGDLSAVTLEMILKPAHYVPPTKKVDEMFDYFQAHNTRVAIILGEYGEVSGIVTMKDVLTFIFGEISGKMAGQEYYKEDDENTYVVPGDMRLADFNNLTNFDIEDSVMATIGGFAFRQFDRLPEPGDAVTYEGYRLVVKQRSGLRISQLLVQKITSSDQVEDADEDEVKAENADNGEPSNSGVEVENKTKSSQVKKDELPDEPERPEEKPAEAKKDKLPDEPQQAGDVPSKAKKIKAPDESQQGGDASGKVKKGKASDEPQQPGGK